MATDFVLLIARCWEVTMNKTQNVIDVIMLANNVVVIKIIIALNVLMALYKTIVLL